jgi:hypothetical protein
MSTKKKQHFVPQLHLVLFTFDGERLHVYDKFKQKAFIRNKRDVAGTLFLHHGQNNRQDTNDGAEQPCHCCDNLTSPRR